MYMNERPIKQSFTDDRKNKRQTGACYERKAAEFLQKKGYEILEMNFRSKAGEIDIVAKDGQYVVFCEVKYRSGSSAGSPLDAVDLRKQKVIFRSAGLYLAVHGLTNVPCRFDVIGITNREILHIKNAFTG